MEKIKSILDLSERFLMGICVFLFAIMVVLGVMIVVFRFIIESSLTFPDEMIRFLFVWVIALGSAIGIRRNIHAAIGILVNALPSTLKRIVLLASTVFTMIFFWVLIQKGYNVTVLSGDQVSPSLEISMAWVYAAIPIGATFGLLYTIELLFNQLKASQADLVSDDR
jgi:TRAP-type C4-dicarboxylate transport system permease small subunit